MGSHSGYEGKKNRYQIPHQLTCSFWFHKTHLLYFVVIEQSWQKSGRLQAAVTVCPSQRNIINPCPKCEISGLLHKLQKTQQQTQINVTAAAAGREASASCCKVSFMAGGRDGGQAMKTSKNNLKKPRWTIRAIREKQTTAFNTHSGKGRKTGFPSEWAGTLCLTGLWDFCLLHEECTDLVTT